MTDHRSNPSERPPAHEKDAYRWNLHRVPPNSPGRSCAIFLVHGIGHQLRTETAVQLRSGFEDAQERILNWQRQHGVSKAGDLPPVFVYEGYWANYDDIEATFPEDWHRFNGREREFFGHLWKNRVFSKRRTVLWFLRQQLNLLRPTVALEVGPLAYAIYFPLQVVAFATLVFAFLRHPKIITEFLNDVRLYLDPRGVMERAIRQQIDYRVGGEFLRMIGLDWEFRPLPSNEQIEASGERIVFERIVWVAHSLGTVISYNVLSDLFHRAASLEQSGDTVQQEGVRRFRKTLVRFVTLGSPLDKVAFLFKDQSLTPWPAGPRRAFVIDGETLKKDDPPETREWWINFYHVLDPVSGPLSNPLICGEQPPSNFHIKSGLIPGAVHLAYWLDGSTLRFILGRAYGAKHLQDQEYKPWAPLILGVLALVSYVVYAGLLLGGAYAVIRWGPALLMKSVLGIFG